MTAAALLEQQGIAVSIWKVNEISSRTEQTLDTLLEQLAPVTVVLEDVVQNGSFSEAVCRAADAHCKEMQLLCINTGNRFLPHGSPAQIYQLCGMDGASVAHLLSKYLT